MAKQRGNDLLNEARDLVTCEARPMIGEDDLRTIEDRITFGREMEVVLNSKSCVQRIIFTRRYYKYAKGVHRDAKFISDRAYDRFRFQFQPPCSTSSETGVEDVYRIARSLYQCWLSCKDPFPSPITQYKWVMDAWNVACLRTNAHPTLLRRDEEIKCDSIKLLTYMKARVNHVVDSAYGFDSSRSHDSIIRNVTRAQALLANTTFIYRDFDFGERPRFIYRHRVIQEIVNLTWFENKDDLGVIFHEYFAPIPLEVIALVVTVVECRIEEWYYGTCNESSWTEGRYNKCYFSHINALRDLNTHGANQEGGDILLQIQHELLRDARLHAGAPPDHTTGYGRLSMDALDAAILDGSP